MDTRHRVLIVDDTPENIFVLMEALKDDYTIVAAKNGEKALEVAQREPRPDLILLDVMMPGMDGYEVAGRLSRIEQTKGIPIIFVTAMSEAGDEARGLALGAVDYITKPVNPTLVKARVKNQMELKSYRDDLEETIAVRTRELLEATAEKEKLESELRVARALQMTMVPAGRAAGEGGEWEVAATITPAKAVGGDLYDYFPLDDGRLCFLMGDVSDKGIPAALFMVKTGTLLRTEAVRPGTPEEILVRVNRELCRDNDRCMFTTLVLGILDLETGDTTVTSAGHTFPVLVSPKKSTEFLLLPGSTALGLDLGARFAPARVTMAPGDSIVFYTDGITEAFNADWKAFGEMRLLDSASRHKRLEPAGIVAALLEDVAAFVGEAPQSDDIAVLALRYRGPPATA
jgi:sigma-B regulation protein RsbU (phosphoserine phosphatase)